MARSLLLYSRETMEVLEIVLAVTESALNVELRWESVVGCKANFQKSDDVYPAILAIIGRQLESKDGTSHGASKVG